VAAEDAPSLDPRGLIPSRFFEENERAFRSLLPTPWPPPL